MTTQVTELNLMTSLLVQSMCYYFGEPMTTIRFDQPGQAAENGVIFCQQPGKLELHKSLQLCSKKG